MNPKYYAEMHNHYYPGGGMLDLVGPFDTLQEAKDIIRPHDTENILIVQDNVIEFLMSPKWKPVYSKDENGVIARNMVAVWPDEALATNHDHEELAQEWYRQQSEKPISKIEQLLMYTMHIGIEDVRDFTGSVYDGLDSIVVRKDEPDASE